MSVQHERLIDLCNKLRLGGVAAQYSALAQNAAEKRTPFTDFLEELLVAERESRRARAREMFARVAGFPSVHAFGATPLLHRGVAHARQQNWVSAQ
jgi:DNA replication protein DnaC